MFNAAKKISLNKNYQISIRTALCILIILSIIIPIFTSFIFFKFLFRKHFEASLYENAVFYMANYSEHIKGRFEDAFNIIYVLHSSNEVIEKLSSGGLITSEDLTSTRNFILNNVNKNVSFENHFINGAFVFVNEDEYVSVLGYDNYSPISDDYKNIYSQYKDSKDVYHIVSPNNSKYLYFIHDLVNISDFKKHGKIIIKMNPHALLNFSNNSQEFNNYHLYLYDSTNKSFFFSNAPMESNSNYVFDGKFLLNLQDYQPIDENYIIITEQIPKMNLSVTLVASKNIIFHNYNRTIALFYSFIIVICFLGVFIGIFFSKIITIPLSNLIFSLNQCTKSNFSVRMPPKHYNEFNELSIAYNKMADKLELLIYEVYEKRLKNNESQISLLQNQLDWDFICDVLKAISSMIDKKKYLGLKNIIDNLQMLIFASNNFSGRNKILIKEELEYVSFYLKLQKIRFGNRLNYQISIESDEILQYYIPPLIIQPIVENSIIHGLEKKRDEGQVSIMIWEEIDEVYIKVVDNGIGFLVENIKEISSYRKQNRSTDAKHTHIALNNISKRLQLLYGYQYCIHIKSTPNVGTEVLINLPIDKGKNEKLS
ncbi:MAG TPA: histidine kinase [Clostridiaceae bacterium]|nr:histidine kinase [Clostridiaceae bacterium]